MSVRSSLASLAVLSPPFTAFLRIAASPAAIGWTAIALQLPPLRSRLPVGGWFGFPGTRPRASSLV
eukprot:2433984-Alexandrium_andersonii.AAC.1